MSTPRPSVYQASEEMRLRDEVKEMQAVIYGSKQFGTEGLLNNQARILKSIENIYRVLIAISVAVGLIFVIILVYWLQLWL